MKPKKNILVGVVGPCGAGKSTLIEGLTKRRYQTRHIAQEHSYVSDMWKRLSNPDILIFLQASYPITCQRHKINWTEAEYNEQQRRLSHARQHASLFVETDHLTVNEVLQRVLDYLNQS